MKLIGTSLSEKDVKIQRKVMPYDGFCRVERWELIHKRFDGSWTESITREFVARPIAVGVLPYDPNSRQVVLIEQFRIGALGRSVKPWLIEIVAGVSDKEHSETDEDIVRRELHEEAGLDAEALLPIYDYFTTPGYSTEIVKLFCAKVDASKAPQFCGLKHEHEDIKIHVLAPEDAFHALHSGQICNAFTIIALQWLELNLDTVNQKWSE